MTWRKRSRDRHGSKPVKSDEKPDKYDEKVCFSKVFSVFEVKNIHIQAFFSFSWQKVHFSGIFSIFR
jgi:hypothetical protein